MADIDWKSHYASEGDIRVLMVSQNNLDQVYGSLSNIDLDSSSITGGYYTDTRTSGKITFYGAESSYIRGAFVRVFYDIPEFEYSREFGTFVVTDDPSTRTNGTWKTNLKLQSAGLYTISTEKKQDPWTLGKGAKCRTAIKQILNSSNRPYIDNASNDKAVTQSTVLENGKSELEWLFSLTDMSNLRLDTDGHGRVTINNYVYPGNKTPIFRIDLEDAIGVALDGISRTTDYLSVAGRAVVVYKYTEQVEVTENGKKKKKSVERQITASADASGYASPTARGYVITDFHSTNQMEPATKQRAIQLAKSYISTSSLETVEWQLTTTYLPLWEGDVVELYIHDGFSRYQGVRRCLVKSIDFNFGSKQMDLTLEEV